MIGLELSWLLRNRLTWLAILLTTLSPLAGLTVYRPLFSNSESSYVTTMQGMYVANPALAAGVLGAVIFALLTVWSLDRIRRGGMEALTHAAASPLTMAAARLGALFLVSALAQAFTMLAWLPWTVSRLGVIFDQESYLFQYLVFMYSSIPLAVLFAAAVYQMIGRADLSLSLFAAFATLSLTVWRGNWQLCWLNPCVWTVSDDFSNYRILWSAAYMRGTWLAALTGFWMFSCLCVRRYGKGAIGSLLCNIRRIYQPLFAAALLVCAVVLYVGQPFLDHSSPEINYDFLFPQEYLETVTCSGRYAQVRPDPKTGRVYGRACFQLHSTLAQEQNVRFLINPGYEITSVQASGKEIPFMVESEQEMNEKAFVVTLPADPDMELAIEYGGYPREWNLASDSQGALEISNVYMSLENDCLSPSPYDIGYQGETLPGVMDLILPGHMTPVLFGAGTTRLLQENGDGTKTWRMEQEGYHMIVYAGDYIRQEIPVETAGIIVHFYYSRRHEPIMEALDAAEMVRETIEFCTEHIGPLSFYGDGVFNLIERRSDGGGYAGDGASIANELDFTMQNLSNNAKGGSFAQVTIHELVHQWWGLGNMFDPMDMDSAWSAEGLTCYTTYRMVKELYGQREAKTSFVDAWQEAVDDYYKSFYVRHPEYLSALPEKYQKQIAGSLRWIRQYNEMPLKIRKAEELVGGQEAMDEILAGLFGRELNPEYPYLTYEEFLEACHLTEEDLNLE